MRRMLDLELSDDQRMVAELATTLGRDVLRPRAAEAEAAASIPDDVGQVVSATGLVAPIPEEFAGQGTLDAPTAMLVAEALAHGDPGLSLALLAPGMAATFVDLCGSQEQRGRWLPILATTPGGRLLIHEGFGRSPSEMRTTAERTDTGTWILHGRKDAIVDATGAVLSIVVARLATGPLTAFVVDSSRSGLTIERDDSRLGKMGLAPAASLAVRIDGLAADESERLAATRQDAVGRAVCRYRLMLAAIAIGTATAAVEYATGYANERVAFGRPIASFQSIGFMLVDARMSVDAARLRLHEAALAVENDGIAFQTIERLTSQTVATSFALATQSTREAVQVLGGHGYLTDHPVERWYRAAATLSAVDFDPLEADVGPL
jgi:hypothetical protein